MVNFFRGLDLRREWLLRKSPPGPMRAFYHLAYPWPEDDYRTIDYVALDLETTGLRAAEHEIVSIGWVPIRGMRLILGESGHQVVRPKGELTAESAVIHGIFHDELAAAPPLAEALARVIPLLAGKVLVAHHAKIEWSFLDAACRKCFGIPFEIPTVDTMVLERRSYRLRNREIPKGGLRLDAVRQTYNLPRYRAHNAMVDAIATGELFLAQAQYRAGGKKAVPLRELSI